MPKLEDDRSKSKDGEGAAGMEEWQLEPGVAGLRVDAIETGRALCSFTTIIVRRTQEQQASSQQQQHDHRQADAAGASKMAQLEADDRSKHGEGAAPAVTEEWQLEPGVTIKMYDVFTMAGLRVDAIEPGRALCSFTVPPRLTDKNKRMHGGALASLVDLVGSAVFYAGGSPSTGVSLEITISYVNAARANEELEIEGTVLGMSGKTGCVAVEVRKKSTGEVIVHGRHTKYLASALAISSKL